jgi:integrase
MSRLFRQQYTKPIPPGAQLLTVRGKPCARFTEDGKTVTRPLTKKGDRIRVPSGKWYCEYTDANGITRRVPLSTDRTAAQQMLAELDRKAERGKAGITDPYETHRKRPLAVHLADYRRDLEARDNVPRYVSATVSRLKSLLDGCGFVFISDLSASRVMDWLADLRRKGRPRAEVPPGQEWFTGREVAQLLGVTPASVSTAVRRHRLPGAGRGGRFPRSTVETLQDRLCRGASVETSNQYLSRLKSFCRWLVKDRRMGDGDNPVAHLQAGNAQVDRRHDRRELEAKELRHLLDVTRSSDRSFSGFTGRDRYVLYATACGTGFRASALASLTPESFNLNADPPTATLAARRNKSRVLKVQPLPADLTELLREYLHGKPAGQAVWGGPWARDGRGAAMLRGDLEAAGIPYTLDGPDGPLYADFHALRHTYLTLGGRAGIDLRTLQELAGHSTPNLTARYSHRRLHDLAGAVEKLPRYLPDGTSDQAFRATGTDGNSPTREVPSLPPAYRTDETERNPLPPADVDARGATPGCHSQNPQQNKGFGGDCQHSRTSESSKPQLAHGTDRYPHRLKCSSQRRQRSQV